VSAGALDGIRVLDLTSVLYGPMASMLLGDMGADVIKIESPEGDTTRQTGPAANRDMASFYLAANRNKRSVVLDLKQPESREALWRLIDGADVFMHSVRPQAMVRLGFAPDAVLQRNPRIVYAGLHGFGEEGPYAGRPAYDDAIQGACGIADLMARVSGTPGYTPMVTADKVCGLTATYAITAALLHRERTGQGQFVEIPMFETATHFTLLEHQYGHTFDPPRDVMGYSRVLAPWRRPYPTKDGHVGVLVYNDGQWRRFAEAIDRPDLLTDPRYRDLNARARNIDVVYALLAEIIATRTTDEWAELLERIEVPCTRINRLEDLESDPHLQAVGFFEKHEHPTEGRLVQMRPPVRFGASPASIRRLPPRLGEHTEDVLREIGMDETAIAMVAKAKKETA
jgi:crotonobetainyl-CoA:carnitine CoA-transferase CaiB-like acyl-CoA transferase